MGSCREKLAVAVLLTWVVQLSACWNADLRDESAAPDEDVETSTDADTESDTDTDSGSDTDADTDSDEDSCSDTGEVDTCCFPSGQEPPPTKEDEICLDPGEHAACWYETAIEDGIACEAGDECLSGECDLDAGLCTCCSQDDCDDGDERKGVCFIEAGICGPSWCNGYWECSAWGGCEWWHADPDYTPDDWYADFDHNPPLVCCEGVYPVMQDGSGSGYAKECE